ncbi:MAG: nuclear transport factor 2 family protein [Acidimicrobiaceae bacterium]|nr:nuclear transport factor 2 family protein [Acidimicrobiaceae bacterium]MBO0748204.1 nuclear transport factor 2 family protein [Acidimicrobiaceae bacterium]
MSTATLATEESPAAVIGRYLDAINGGDADLAAAMVSEDFVSEHPSDPTVDLVGRAAHRERLRAVMRELRGVSYEAEDVISTGVRVALPYRMTGQWCAPDGTGHPFSLRGVFVFTVCEGKITRRADYWDGMDFARQVGIS